MLVDREYLESLTPVEVERIKAYIDQVYKTKVTDKTTNEENLVTSVHCCPHCGSVHYVKNGFNPHHRQKYLCRDCHSVFLATTGTIFSHSSVTYEQWITLIACEINRNTLREEEVAIGLTKTTCFHMRHKLYEAASRIVDSQKLSGQIELDPTYTKINLKGRKPKDMPRFSKKRGKGIKLVDKHLRGISHHKVCLVTAIDENDNMLFKIAGLGPEKREFLTPLGCYFTPGSTVICDEKRCLETFVREQGMTPEVIRTHGFKSDKGNTLADVNQLHQELSDLISRRHGVSSRHMQGYMDWLIYRKQLKYRVEGRRQKVESYVNVMTETVRLITKELFRIPLPIDLYAAYGEYHFGIFANIN